MAFEREIVGVEDLVLLTSKLNVTNIGKNLDERLKEQLIYTYIGHVLVVMNPFKWLNIYDDFWISKYVLKNRVDEQPHIYAVAESAYRMLTMEEENQCVIISGESGAGKTEAAKGVMNYISKVSGGKGNMQVQHVKTVILQSNPILEAFGNAMTIRNNNSSRFGKYFAMEFDRVGQPRGGKITSYMLERYEHGVPHPLYVVLLTDRASLDC